jgi:hypothetical protein
MLTRLPRRLPRRSRHPRISRRSGPRAPFRCYYYSDEQGDYSLPADGDYDGDGRDDCQEQAEQSGPDSVDWEYCD